MTSMYFATLVNADGTEPVGGSNKAIRHDLTTDAGARRWMARLVFYAEGRTRLYRFADSSAFYRFDGKRIA